MKMINNWQDVPFKKYIEISKLDFQLDDLTNAINLVSILSDKSVEDIDKIKAKDFTKYSSNLQFILTEPDFKTSKFDWKIKKIEDITVDDFIAFENLKDENFNYPAIMSFMSVNNLDEDAINKMSTIDVLNGFFLLKKKLQKYMVTTLQSLILKAMKEKMQKLAFWRKKPMR